MGMINSYLSLIFPSGTSAFGIFILRQTFKQVPEDLIEAARLDNAGEWKIMLPIARPTIATLALITFVNSWNDYFWPFVVTKQCGSNTSHRNHRLASNADRC